LVLALVLGWDAQHALCATPADVRLVELARSNFANLTKAELALLRFAGANRAPGGAFAAAGPSSNPDDPRNDPAHADEWSKDREVRAAVIWWLCVDPEAIRCTNPQGLRLLGARIVGGLNLSTVRVPFAITLRNCSISEVIDLTSTTIGNLDLSGSYTGPIHASLINVADSLVLGNGFHAAGRVTLSGAKIGLLSASAGHFRYLPELGDYLAAFKPALLADLKPALDLNGAQIKGQVFMDRGESQGAVMLAHAAIGGDLVCTSGRFINPGNVAILAPGAEIGGTVYLWGEQPLRVGAARPFEGNGLLTFESARVQGEFIVDGARFIGPGAPPVNGGGLNGPHLEVRSGFAWRWVLLENGAQLRLKDASVGFIVDQERAWPPPGNLVIDGFVYSYFQPSPGDSPWDARTRLRWLALQPPGFHPQPYRQLAKVLRESGDEPGAIQVLIAKEDASYRQFGLLGRFEGAFLKATIGYGYQPLRTIGWSLLVVLFGWSVVWAAKRARVMRATWPENAPTSSEPDYEDLHPFLYSLDVFLPFVNLHQEHYWWPDSKTSGQCALLGYRLRLRGSLVWYYLWLQVISGWLLSATFVAGLTGLMRSN
jgi:hypothetical protein